ncbi:MAG: YraN family protein [Phycisphaerales bacterium]
MSRGSHGRAPASPLGRRGERIAARYLRRRGYRLLARNRRVGPGEADLVCLAPDGRTIVVVEVKTRRPSPGERRPESAVGASKQAKLRRVTQAVRARLGAASQPVRIDVLAVEPQRWPRRAVVRHIERAVTWS